MPDAPQSSAHHTRWDPLYHFFVMPVFLLGALALIIHSALDYRDWVHGIVHVLVGVAALIAILRIRMYPLKVQDRVIRLEERLRLATLLPEPLRARIPELSEGQLIALRFASDKELPALAQKALDERLTPGAIKQSIQNWRPDYWRV